MEWFRKTIQKIKGDGGLTDQDFVIQNAEALRDANPRQFSIPRSDQRFSLKVGDSAKILLESRFPSGPITGERTWVTVTNVENNDRYKVKIDNCLALFPSLDEATLEIGPENVISVILPDDFVLPFEKTCQVSHSVLNNESWPSNLVRDSPTNPEDSGWRIFSSSEALTDASNVVLCEQLISMYQVLDSVLDEPELASWMWQQTGNEFSRVRT